MLWCTVLFQCRAYLDPMEVFKGEVEETVVKVRVVVNNLQALKDVYEKYRANIVSYSHHGEQAKDWEFAPVLVFHRYDKFVERVQLIYVRYHQSQSIVQFLTAVSTRIHVV